MISFIPDFKAMIANLEVLPDHWHVQQSCDPQSIERGFIADAGQF